MEFENADFWGEGKTGVPLEKPLGIEKIENQQQTQPTHDAGSGSRENGRDFLSQLGSKMMHNQLLFVAQMKTSLIKHLIGLLF